MQVGKVTVDLRREVPLTVEWWPVVRQSAKCLDIRRPIRREWQDHTEQYEVMLQKSRLWKVNMHRRGVSATVFVTAEEGREDAAVHLALQGVIEELRNSLRGMTAALEAVEKEIEDGC